MYNQISGDRVWIDCHASYRSHSERAAARHGLPRYHTRPSSWRIKVTGWPNSAPVWDIIIVCREVPADVWEERYMCTWGYGTTKYFSSFFREPLVVSAHPYSLHICDIRRQLAQPSPPASTIAARLSGQILRLRLEAWLEILLTRRSGPVQNYAAVYLFSFQLSRSHLLRIYLFFHCLFP
jgi:hypothetical protein